eukprot:3175333-Rhodomonas_salina.1
MATRDAGAHSSGGWVNRGAGTHWHCTGRLLAVSQKQQKQHGSPSRSAAAALAVACGAAAAAGVGSGALHVELAFESAADSTRLLGPRARKVPAMVGSSPLPNAAPATLWLQVVPRSRLVLSWGLAVDCCQYDAGGSPRYIPPSSSQVSSYASFQNFCVAFPDWTSLPASLPASSSVSS